jgi:Ca2+-binding RTX toxin-like protein
MFKAEYKNIAGWTGLVVQLKQAPLPVLMQGDDGNNTLESLNGNNTLDGLGGDDVLISGAGNDALRGGAGNDWVSFAPFSCAVTANLATGRAGGTESGTDTLTEIENIRGGYGDDSLTGDDGANVLHGNSGNDSLDGNAGDDTIDGGRGKDAVKGGDGDDLFLIRGDEAANDSFDGGKGTDTIRNDGAGDVIFNVFKPTVIEVFDNTGTDGLAHAILGTQGNDTLSFAGLTLIGVTGIHGLAGNDNLTGNDANNRLDGGAGNDTMAGGKGDDDYVVDSSGDKIVEKKNEGIDSVTITGFTAGKAFTLANDVENLLLAGAFALAVTGNGLANEIVGNDGANTITGAGGNDTVTGGGGNDAFVMTPAMGIDVITDFAVGEDVLDASKLGLTLAQVLGVLTQDGADAKFDFGKNGAVILEGVDGAGLAPAQFVTKAFISTTPQQGDDEANTIGGAPGSSKDFLIGWGGADSLSGGDGNDTLVGGFGDDTLDGGAGADSLLGGDGDDLYRVDNSGDRITEVVGGGTDAVESGISYTLAAFVENLTLTSATNINGTGNELANALIGNTGKNVLDGKAGDDTLTGAIGNDTLKGGDGNDTLTGGIGADNLTGGKGADRFVYETVADSGVKANKEPIDVITDFKPGEDLIDLTAFGLTSITVVANAFSAGGSAEALLKAGILSLDLGGDGTSDFDIAMSGLKSILDTDFIL